MTKKNIDDLRDVLFAALAEAKDKTKPLDVPRMRAISDIAARITDTARVEVDFMRASGKQCVSGFVPLRSKEGDEKAYKTPEHIATRTGVASIDSVPGGRVIAHKMR
jgi:hypothetical protein